MTLTGFNFYITLIEEGDSAASQLFDAAKGLAVGGFSECTGLEASLELEEYREGGVNDRVYKFPTRSVYSNITLKRGVGLSEDLWLWYEGFLKGEGVRKKGMIVLTNELKIPIKIWSFEGGMPIKWTGPSLNATSSAVAIESLEIAHEKLELMMSPGKALDAIAGALF